MCGVPQHHQAATAFSSQNKDEEVREYKRFILILL
jgi:hypothetical protein